MRRPVREARPGVAVRVRAVGPAQYDTIRGPEARSTDAPAVGKMQKHLVARIIIVAGEVVLDLRRLPGVAQRAILNAAKEKRTALIYDAPLGVVEWQRRLRDVARGQLRHPVTGKSRRLAVLDGSALQTCAPRCPAKPLTDARKTWARTSSVFRDATKSFTVGHKANETAAASVAAGVAGVGDADWLENLGGWPTSARGRRRTTSLLLWNWATRSSGRYRGNHK